jgi:hypothetical protein
VSEPETYTERALHDDPPGGETLGAAATRVTSTSVPGDDEDPLSLTERNRRRLRERWGKPIDEPPHGPDTATDGDGFGWREIRRGFGVHLHLHQDPRPSMRAVRADYKHGLEDAQDQSATASVAYRLFGLTGQGFAYVFAFAYTCCIRPGRFAASLFITLLLTTALWWAGLI